MNTFVGFRKIDVTDSRKDVTFPMLVMYPTVVPSRDNVFGPFTLDVAPGAPVKEGHFPLVVISHGTCSSNMVFRTLARYLALHGFIVCLPEHPADNLFDNSLQYTYENMVNRPRHISLSIDTITSHPDFKTAVQADKVTVAGHSVGGYTALAVGGGHPDTSFLVDFCNRPENHEQPYWTRIIRETRLPAGPVEVVADERVKALVILAPDVSLFMHDNALENVKVPVLLMVAEKDLWPQEVIDAVRKNIGNASALELKIIKNAGHYSFISGFPETIKDKVGEAAMDPAGFDRQAFQNELQSDILNFINTCQ
jgi:predicted dienelactone hydrolase